MKPNRIQSIDIFRGITMIMMTIVNNPGDWGHVYGPLLHAEWHGYTPTDLVFPFFIFAMGLAMPFTKPSVDIEFWPKLFSRTLRIFNLGLFLNLFSKINVGHQAGLSLLFLRITICIIIGIILLGNFNLKAKLYLAIACTIGMFTVIYFGGEAYDSVRIPGVLQRIALVYFFSSLIINFLDQKWQYVVAISILIFYWVLMAYVPVPGLGEASFEKGSNMAAWFDNLFLEGHMWATSKTWDPEGLLSTFPAIVTALLGVFFSSRFLKNINTQSMTLSGIVLLAIGTLWSFIFPINKALWTSSYVLVAGAWAILIVTLIVFLFEKKKETTFTQFLSMWGVNPMIVFFGSGVIPRVLNLIKINDEGLISYIYQNWICNLISSPKLASLAGALVYVLIWSLILYFLKSRKVIVKV